MAVWTKVAYLLLFISILLIQQGNTLITGCAASRFRDVIGTAEKDDYIIYGLTQDCQLFFVRPYQLDYLKGIQVDPRNSYCSPSVVQLHVLSATTLLLLMRQGPSRLCTLEVSIPPPEILFGSHVFRYSLVTSIRFLVCSHSESFRLDSAQTFLDTAFQDVVYAVDGDSAGRQWTAKQMVLRNGTLRLLSTVTFDHYSQDRKESKEPASSFVIGSDSSRHSLVTVNRQSRSYTTACLFDLLFRPESVKADSGQLENPFGGAAELNSVASDGPLVLIGEEKRAGPFATSTFLYAVNSSVRNARMSCIAQLDFATKIGVVRISTIKKLTDEPLPKFSPQRKKEHHPKVNDDLDESASNRVNSGARSTTARPTARVFTSTPKPRITEAPREERPEDDQFSVNAVGVADQEEEEDALNETQDSPMDNERANHHREHLTTREATVPELATQSPSPSDLPQNDTLTASSPALGHFICACIACAFNLFRL